MTVSLAPVATLERDTDSLSLRLTVWVDFPNAGVDRPRTHGTSVGRDRRLGERLVAAINAGVAEIHPRVVADVEGATYVLTERRYMGKYLNADLRKLGF